MVPTGHTHEPSPHHKIDDKKLANDHSPPKTGIQMYLGNCKPTRECNYCEQVTEEPLLRYLLECDATDDLRIKVGKPPHDANIPDATKKATEMVYSIIEKIEETKTTPLECPLPDNV